MPFNGAVKLISVVEYKTETVGKGENKREKERLEAAVMASGLGALLPFYSSHVPVASLQYSTVCSVVGHCDYLTLLNPEKARVGSFFSPLLPCFFSPLSFSSFLIALLSLFLSSTSASPSQPPALHPPSGSRSAARSASAAMASAAVSSSSSLCAAVSSASSCCGRIPRLTALSGMRGHGMALRGLGWDERGGKLRRGALKVQRVTREQTCSSFLLGVYSLAMPVC